MFYHGSPYKLSDLKSPNETGIIRKSEELRGHHKDVVFMTTSIERALTYAGSEGYLYQVTADARQYNKYENSRRDKKRRYKLPLTNVYVANSNSINIIKTFKLLPRKRQEKQQFKKI